MRTVYVLCILTICMSLAAVDVVLEKLPQGQLAPILANDANGAIHLLYFGGDPKSGDIFYRKKDKGAADFSAAVQVNSVAGSSMVIGGVRAPDMAVSADGTVHVAWMSMKDGKQAIFYARSNNDGSAFSKQQNVMQRSEGLDAGVTVAAHDDKVYVMWPAHGRGNAENQRVIYCAYSKNAGKKFSAEVPLNADRPGVCACCGIDAATSADGELQVMYRNVDSGSRNVVLMHGTPGKKWSFTLLDEWKVNMCPMSSMYVGGGDSGLLSWQTQEQVYFATLENSKTKDAAPGMGGKRKHSVILRNADGVTCRAWTEGTGWNKGGRVAWQLVDAAGKEISAGNKADLPAWSRPALALEENGNFLLMY